MLMRAAAVCRSGFLFLAKKQVAVTAVNQRAAALQIAARSNTLRSAWSRITSLQSSWFFGRIKRRCGAGFRR